MLRFYIGRDTGLDAEQGCRAETRVREWRAKGMLPFPEFGDEHRRELEDVLDYPPKGSPDNPTPHSRVETEPMREGEDPTSSEGEPQSSRSLPSTACRSGPSRGMRLGARG